MPTNIRYADKIKPETPPEQDLRDQHRHNANIGIIMLMPTSA
jgi:hypothetical protein